jgi:hypothetical protein
MPKTEKARFVEYNGDVHILNPALSEYTLCGDAFDISAVDAEQSEFTETEKRAVSCLDCARIIKGVRGVRLHPVAR